jgi:hypothetical protein
MRHSVAATSPATLKRRLSLVRQFELHWPLRLRLIYHGPRENLIPNHGIRRLLNASMADSLVVNGSLIFRHRSRRQLSGRMRYESSRPIAEAHSYVCILPPPIGDNSPD